MRKGGITLFIYRHTMAIASMLLAVAWGLELTANAIELKSTAAKCNVSHLGPTTCRNIEECDKGKALAYHVDYHFTPDAAHGEAPPAAVLPESVTCAGLRGEKRAVCVSSMLNYVTQTP